MRPLKLTKILSKATKSITTSAARVDAGSSARSAIIFANDPTSADSVLLEVVVSGGSASGVYVACLDPGATWTLDLTSDNNVEVHGKCAGSTATLYVTEFA